MMTLSLQFLGPRSQSGRTSSGFMESFTGPTLTAIYINGQVLYSTILRAHDSVNTMGFYVRYGKLYAVPPALSRSLYWKTCTTCY